MQALKAQVVVVNNGTSKGWQNSAWETVMKSPGLEDTWQLHKAMGANHDHNVDENHIAMASANRTHPDEQIFH